VACSLFARQRRHAALALAASAVCLAVLVVGIAPASVARHQDAPRIQTVLRDLYPDQSFQLGTCEYFTPNLVFYAADKVHRVKQTKIADFFTEHPHALLLTRADRLKGFRSELPGNVVELARQKRFLRDHDLVLLGKPMSTTAARTASKGALAH
jgi:hypothetical protein